MARLERTPSPNAYRCGNLLYSYLCGSTTAQSENERNDIFLLILLSFHASSVSGTYRRRYGFVNRDVLLDTYPIPYRAAAILHEKSEVE